MDLSTISHKVTTDITIYDPWGEPTDIVVTLYGRDTKEYRNAALELARESQGANESQDETDRRGARLILAAVKDWRNVANGGEAIAPDSKEAVDLLARDEMDWFASQIHKAINNRALFFTKHASD